MGSFSSELGSAADFREDVNQPSNSIIGGEPLVKVSDY